MPPTKHLPNKHDAMHFKGYKPSVLFSCSHHTFTCIIAYGHAPIHDQSPGSYEPWSVFLASLRDIDARLGFQRRVYRGILIQNPMSMLRLNLRSLTYVLDSHHIYTHIVSHEGIINLLHSPSPKYEPSHTPRMAAGSCSTYNRITSTRFSYSFRPMYHPLTTIITIFVLFWLIRPKIAMIGNLPQ